MREDFAVPTNASALTDNDPRYEQMFSVEKEIEHVGSELIEDLYPKLADLRSKQSILKADLHETLTGKANPLFADGRPHYTTLTFDTSNKVFMDNNTYSSHFYHEMPLMMENIGHTIITMIGKEHSRYRSSVQPMMTRQQAMGWWREKWIESFVAKLVDDIEQQKEGVDLSLALCARLPMHTVTAAYGLTSDEALNFRDNLLVSVGSQLTHQERLVAREKVREVLLNAIAERRKAPRDDLISRMMEAPFTDENGNASHLSDEDILSFSRLLLLAGGGTTFRQMGILIFALLSNPDQMEDLRADRSLMQAAIEESLRWECTDPLFHRLAVNDSVLDGVDIPAGTIIDVCMGSANRDPSRWDNADAYDLHRPEKRHLGFASGPHTCLGRFVASAEMTATVNALLDRLPKLRFDDRHAPAQIIGGLQARGVNHLRVRFD